MTTEPDLLKTIEESPEDETKRLVYADWLDENKNSNGPALVRLHCEMIKAAKRSPALTKFFPEEIRALAKCGESWVQKYEDACEDVLLPISVSRSWFRIRRRIDEDIPPLRGSLNKGATLKEIHDFEKAIGQKLPEDVKHSYRIYNGERDIPHSYGLFLGDSYESLKAVLEAWQMWAEIAADDLEDLNEVCTSYPEGAIQCKYARKEWIPIMGMRGTSDHIGIDLAPGPKGCHGQVIIFGRDEEIHCVVGLNWADFLQKFADLLEQLPLDGLNMEEADGFYSEFNAKLITPGPHHAYQFRDGLRVLIEGGKW